MDSEDDLYVVLGVESGASADAIKAAYRNLVREHHPDRKQLTPEDIAEADARMAALNHAWEVLSDPGRRRLYNEQRHVDELLRRAPAAGEPLVPTSSTTSPASSETTSSTAVEAAVASRVSQQLRSRFLSAEAPLRWERLALPEFDWALTARPLLTRYVAALRSDAAADEEHARRFVAAAQSAVQAANPKATHYLFLLLVGSVSGLDKVRTICRAFSESKEGKGSSVVLLDATRSRALLCSPPPRDGNMKALLAELGVD
jgi:curved DNA-binding protein CbpA